MTTTTHDPSCPVYAQVRVCTCGAAGVTDLDTLAAIVSDSLAATTEGTDYDVAPDPSDEPGSPYVLRLTNELFSRGVRVATSPEAPGLTTTNTASHGGVTEQDIYDLGFRAGWRERGEEETSPETPGLREAAQAVVDAWESGDIEVADADESWHARGTLLALRAALATKEPTDD